jgi:hypothetical protein
VEVNEDLFEDEDGFQTPRNSPQPATPRNLRRGSRKGSRANSRGSNPEGLQTFPQKPQKEIGILIKEFYFT